MPDGLAIVAKSIMRSLPVIGDIAKMFEPVEDWAILGRQTPQVQSWLLSRWELWKGYFSNIVMEPPERLAPYMDQRLRAEWANQIGLPYSLYSLGVWSKSSQGIWSQAMAKEFEMSPDELGMYYYIDLPKAKIREKLTWLHNLVYPTRIPDLEDIWELLTNDLITEAEAVKLFQQHLGYPESLIWKLLPCWYYDFTITDLFRICRNVSVNTDWLRKQLRKIGLEKGDIDLMVKVLQRELIKDDMLTLISSMRSWVGAGILDLGEFSRLLDELGVNPEEKEYHMKIAKLSLDKAIASNMVEREIYLYRRDVLTEDELYERMKLRGVNPLLANSIVSLEAAKKGKEWIAPSP